MVVKAPTPEIRTRRPPATRFTVAWSSAAPAGSSGSIARSTAVARTPSAPIGADAALGVLELQHAIMARAEEALAD